MDQERRDTEEQKPSQSYGQGAGEHEPAIPDEDGDDAITSYSEGTAGEPEAPSSLTREEEGMDR